MNLPQSIQTMKLRESKTNANIHWKEKKSTNCTNILTREKHHSIAFATSLPAGCRKSSLLKQRSTNELLHPISPFDEIPAIRALVEKLSLGQNPRGHCRWKETRQDWQDCTPQSHRHDSRQQPDGFPPFKNDAHEVPSVIQIFTKSSYSEDSELSLEPCFRCHETSSRDGNEDSMTTRSTDQQYIQCHNFVDIDHELSWPSDEDNASLTKR